LATKELSLMAKFEAECKLRVCIRCKEKRLIPKEPGNYKKMRCTNCGCLLTLIKEDDCSRS
jgi:hypothetical protein